MVRDARGGVARALYYADLLAPADSTLALYETYCAAQRVLAASGLRGNATSLAFVGPYMQRHAKQLVAHNFAMAVAACAVLLLLFVPHGVHAALATLTLVCINAGIFGAWCSWWQRAVGPVRGQHPICLPGAP